MVAPEGFGSREVPSCKSGVEGGGGGVPKEVSKGTWGAWDTLGSLCTCETLCERPSGLSFIWVVIGSHIGQGLQLRVGLQSRTSAGWANWQRMLGMAQVGVLVVQRHQVIFGNSSWPDTSVTYGMRVTLHRAVAGRNRGGG